MGYLTVRKVEHAKPGRYTDGHGLLLHVRPTGSKYWVLRIQIDGRRRDVGLGSVSPYDSLSELDEVPLLEKCVLTLAEARLKAATLRQMAKAGRDPVVELSRDRSPIPNFNEAALKAYEAKLPEWSATTAESFMSSMEKHAFPQLGKILVSDVDAATIAKTLSAIWMTTPQIALKVRQRIGLVLNYAEAQSWRTSSMPNDAISMLLPKQLEGGHFDAMPYKEVPAFVASLNATLSIGRLALLFLIFTAARSGEVRGAKWNQIDMAERLWHRPAELMKGRNAKAHTVTLNSEALAIIEIASQFRRNSTDLIFPSRSGGELSDMALSSFMDGIFGTPHGFRSSFRDWAAEKMPHIPDPVAEAAIAHKVSNKVVAAYKRTAFLEMRRVLLDEWGVFSGAGALFEHSDERVTL
jgi:integrase